MIQVLYKQALVLSFLDSNVTRGYRRYFLPNTQIEDSSVMTDGQKFFDQPVKSDIITYDNIQKISTGQGNLLKNYCKMIATDLSNQQTLDIDPKTIQQISFTGNLSRKGSATVFFIIGEEKETISDFSQTTVKVL